MMLFQFHSTAVQAHGRYANDINIVLPKRDGFEPETAAFGWKMDKTCRRMFVPILQNHHSVPPLLLRIGVVKQRGDETVNECYLCTITQDLVRRRELSNGRIMPVRLARV